MVYRPTWIGKSTLAFELEHRLFQQGKQAYVLDGDNIRLGLSSDLGFSPKIVENIRRIGEVAGLFAKAGFIVITAYLPYQADRNLARRCMTICSKRCLSIRQ